jgi:4-hydroxy-tetrahydrodipicolinate synthase
MLDHQASGVYIIAATPFTEDGAIDFTSVARMVDFYVAAEVNGITVLGMMGEAPKLTHEEALALS